MKTMGMIQENLEDFKQAEKFFNLSRTWNPKNEEHQQHTRPKATELKLNPHTYNTLQLNCEKKRRERVAVASKKGN